MAQIKKDVVTWLSAWFPLKGSETRSLSEVVTSLTGSITSLSNSKADKNLGTANMNVVTDSSGAIGLGDKNDHSHGSINKSGQLNSDISSVNKVVVTDSSGNMKTISKLPTGNVTHQSITGKADKSGGVAQVTDANSKNYTNLGLSTANNSQQLINAAINEKIGQLLGVEFVKVVSTIPTASADTMNKLYVVTGDTTSDGDDFGIFVTYKEDDSYKWEQVDDAILKGYITQTSADSKYAPIEHTHIPAEIEIPNTINIPYLRSSTNITNLQLLLVSINGVIAGLSTKSETITSVELIDKGETDEGCIIFNTVS